MPREVEAIFSAPVESAEDASDCRLASVALTGYDVRFRMLFEESGSIMLLIEPSDGVIVDANQAASAFYGYTRDRLIGLPISQINTLPSEETALERKRALREKRSHFNFRHRLACGEERDVEVYSSPIVVDGRQLLFSIVHDVSARTRAEAQLRDSEERYRLTFEQAAVGIVHTAIEGRFLRCNARFAGIIGYPLEEVGGLTFQQITPPGELAECQRVNQQIWSGAAAHATLEKRYIRKDGSLIWAKLTVSVLRDSEGRGLHSITMVEDINALKASQEALRISETHYRTIFQTSLDGIAISQMSDGRYIDVNRAFLDILGYAREEMIGRTSVELGIWIDTKDRQNIVEELRQESFVRDAKVRYRRKNGELFWIQISSTVIEIEGVACLLSVVRNISDAKAAED
ncbi:MAG: PAS domain S-box protein, partial [Terracidiphilus sp.]